MKVFVDLFAGLGGASEAFYNDPNWVVIRVDNNHDLVEHTRGLHIIDLVQNTEWFCQWLEMMLDEIGDGFSGDVQLVIWASPPCTEYSLANPNRPDTPNHECLEAALHIIDALEPEHYIIENVKGAIKYFDEITRTPYRQRVGPFYLWGNFPLLAFRDISDANHSKLLTTGSRALRPNMRALVPYAVSLALKNSFEHQRTLF